MSRLGWCLISASLNVYLPSPELIGMDVDPDTLLEWLAIPGDMQLVALEQLCMLLLLADNVDHVFERSVILGNLLYSDDMTQFG